jgi:hypothetical protein
VAKFYKHIVESREEIQDEIEAFFTEFIDCSFAEGEGNSCKCHIWRSVQTFRVW